jgi:exosortase A
VEQQSDILRPQQKVASWQAILVLFFFIFAFFPVWRSLINAWSNSEDYSHAFFIVPISLYLIWIKKGELEQIPKKISIIGLCFFALSLSIYLVAFIAKIATITATAMVFTIVTLVWTLYGTQVVKLLAFPLFFLFLMVPIPSQIYSAATIPLQLFVSKVSTMLAMAADIPVYREGNVLHLPDRTLQVVEACSGLRSIISLFTLSLVFGYLYHSSNITRILLTSTTIPIAVLVNIVRVLTMLSAFYFFNLDLTSGTLHTYFGIIVFLMALALLYLISRILSQFK